MKFALSIKGFQARLFPFWRRHRLLLVTLFTLSLVAASSRFLRGSIVGLPPDVATFFEASMDPRVCSSTGTVFMNLKTLKGTTDLFRQTMSSVVGEHEEFLKTPSSWPCLTGQEGGIGILTDVAKKMPGWYYVPASGDPKLLPVTYASFASVIGEFEREYECKLAEFKLSADAMVANNRDIDDPNSFCCDEESNVCKQITDVVACASTPSDDATCAEECPINNTQEAYGTRLTAFQVRIESDKEHARLAVLRTLHALRSFELNYAYAKQLVCFQRASLDLKNELGLLADTMSCMPKIWDAVTSLHDPDDSLTPVPPSGP